MFESYRLPNYFQLMTLDKVLRELASEMENLSPKTLYCLFVCYLFESQTGFFDYRGIMHLMGVSTSTWSEYYTALKKASCLEKEQVTARKNGRGKEFNSQQIERLSQRGRQLGQIIMKRLETASRQADEYIDQKREEHMINAYLLKAPD